MNPDLAQFILLFSRFEFAMKQSANFRRCGAERKRGAEKYFVAEANWDALAAAFNGTDLLERMQADDVAAELWQMPPNSLVISQQTGETVWLTADPFRVRDKLFEPVKWLRNIVAHGDSPGLTGRPLRLVKGGIIVLDEALTAARTVAALEEFLNHVAVHDELGQL